MAAKFASQIWRKVRAPKSSVAANGRPSKDEDIPSRPSVSKRRSGRSPVEIQSEREPQRRVYYARLVWLFSVVAS